MCKWSFEADGKTAGWNTKFFHEIGLEDLTSNGFLKIGTYWCVAFLFELISRCTFVNMLRFNLLNLWRQ